MERRSAAWPFAGWIRTGLPPCIAVAIHTDSSIVCYNSVKGDEAAMHIQLRPEVEAYLQEQAAAQGTSLETYVQTLIEQTVMLVKPETGSEEEFEAAMDALSEGLDHLPILSSDALTREGIYRDDD